MLRAKLMQRVPPSIKSMAMVIDRSVDIMNQTGIDDMNGAPGKK
jgi:hypothetical protein